MAKSCDASRVAYNGTATCHETTNQRIIGIFFELQLQQWLKVNWSQPNKILSPSPWLEFEMPPQVTI